MSRASSSVTCPPRFAHLTAADDLEFRYAINAPTVRIDGMTVAGK